MRGNTGCGKQLPRFLSSLFWEYAAQSIDIVEHARAIMERVMERGSWESMIWLRKTYSGTELVSYLEDRGKRVLPPRELNYWALVCGIPFEKRKEWLKEALDRNDVWSTRHAH
jgi:hypothetical protein